MLTAYCSLRALRFEVLCRCLNEVALQLNDQVESAQCQEAGADRSDEMFYDAITDPVPRVATVQSELSAQQQKLINDICERDRQRQETAIRARESSRLSDAEWRQAQDEIAKYHGGWLKDAAQEAIGRFIRTGKVPVYVHLESGKGESKRRTHKSMSILE